MVRMVLLNGQPRPWQRTLTRAPTGATMVSRRIRVPLPVTRPVIRTTGNGLSRRSVLPEVPTWPGGSTFTVCTCEPNASSALVTRSPIG